MLIRILIAAFLTGIFSVSVYAQDDEARVLEILGKDAKKLEDLSFPAESSELGVFSNIHNGLFKPVGKGDGPFPALVIAHSCGGIKPAEMRYWVEAALQEGYVVLVVDSMRGNKINCYPPLPVPTGRRLKDLYAAIDHLSKLQYVDSKKIAGIGFSQGAHLAALLASPGAQRVVSPNSQRYAATVGLYGTCEWPAGALKHIDFRVAYLLEDTDRPLLYLMGKDDRETPSEYCDRGLPSLKSGGVPVEWHVYPSTTHCWDCSSLDGFSKIDHKGERVSYRYDKGVTDDSRRRVFDFLARYLK